jgi:hypothetical protein
MPRKGKSSKPVSDQPLPPIAKRDFWKRFQNPPPVLAFAFEELDDEEDESLNVLLRLPKAPSEASLAYSLKVVLDDSRPLIWRRILVPDISLETLHDVIQIAFGWEDAHLHGFEVKNVHVPAVDDGEKIDERDISVGQLHAARTKKFHYTYDFGDSWAHTIWIERASVTQVTNVLPKCVAGRGYCPLEDVGGIFRWMNVIDAFKHPERDRDDWTEWQLARLPDDFTPQTFDRETINLQLQRAFKKARPRR